MTTTDPRDLERSTAPARAYDPWHPPTREARRAYLDRVVARLAR